MLLLTPLCEVFAIGVSTEDRCNKYILLAIDLHTVTMVELCNNVTYVCHSWHPYIPTVLGSEYRFRKSKTLRQLLLCRARCNLRIANHILTDVAGCT